MPDARCRFGGDCRNVKRNACRFVHPDDPLWDKLSSNERRDGPPRSAGSSSDWNAHSPEVTASNNTPVAEGKNRWNFPDASKSGNNDNTGTSPTKERNPASAWNFTSKAKATNTSTNAESSSNSWNWPSSKGQNSIPRSSGDGWGDWGLGDKATSTSSGAGWATGEGGWGKSNAEGPTTNITSSGSEWGSGGGWGGGGGGGGSGGWGIDATANAPENGKSSRGTGDWGSGSSVEKSWGTSDDRISEKKASGAGWGSIGSGQSSNWNADSPTQSKNKDKGKAADVQMHDPSPQRMPLPVPTSSKPWASSGAQKSAQTSDLPRLQPAASCHPPIPGSTSAPLSAVIQKSFEPPTPVDFKKAALEASKELSQSSPVSAKSLKFRGQKGRRALYASSIKHMHNAVLFHLEVHKVQDDLERWRRTQNSSIYGHSGQKTRKILDTERSGYNQQLQEAKIKFQHEINLLIDLPDFSDQQKAPQKSTLTKEVVAAYTQELQDWFKDLELHKRLLVEKTEEENEGEVHDASPAEIEEGEVMEEEEEEEVPKQPSDLRAQGKWTWKELKEATEALEGRVAAAQENYYFDVFTSIQDDRDDELNRVKTRLKSLDRKESAQSVDLSSSWNVLGEVGSKIETQSQDLSQLLQKVDKLEKELGLLLQEKARMDPIIELANRQFEEFESWKETDASQISEMTEQIKSLHLYKPKPTSTSSTCGSTTITLTTNPVSPTSAAQPPEPQPVTTSSLLEYVRPLIVNILQSDLTPVFETLRQRCAENQHLLQAELEEEAQKILALSQAVKAKIDTKGDVSVPSTVPPITNVVDVAQL